MNFNTLNSPYRVFLNQVQLYYQAIRLIIASHLKSQNLYFYDIFLKANKFL